MTGAALADLTTLRVGGPAGRVVTASDESQIVAEVQAADAAGTPLLILGGGSNVVIADEGWPGTVLLIRSSGIDQADGCGASRVVAAAGEDWDGLVAHCIAAELAGVECLAGIPGRTGATPIQNVGAYGQDVAQVIDRVRAYDRTDQKIVEFMPPQCRFTYRSSRFKQEPGRFVILAVSFRLERSDRSRPVRYPELARLLGVGVGDRAPLEVVRDGVVRLRRGKGMVLDAADHDTWSAGSFFTNPIVPGPVADSLPPDVPRFRVDGGFKLSAAFLIESAGFGRGFGDGRARLSRKHALAITNTGQARASDVIDLARTIRDGVRERYGVELVPEPVMVNCAF